MASGIIVSMLYSALLPTTAAPLIVTTTTPAPIENTSTFDEGTKDLGTILTTGDIGAIGALPIGIVIGVAAGLGCCCCCISLLVCIILKRRCSRKRYKTQISAQEDEDEGSADEQPLALTQGESHGGGGRRSQRLQALDDAVGLNVPSLENAPS